MNESADEESEAPEKITYRPDAGPKVSSHDSTTIKFVNQRAIAAAGIPASQTSESAH